MKKDQIERRCIAVKFVHRNRWNIAYAFYHAAHIFLSIHIHTILKINIKVSSTDLFRYFVDITVAIEPVNIPWGSDIDAETKLFRAVLFTQQKYIHTLHCDHTKLSSQGQQFSHFALSHSTRGTVNDCGHTKKTNGLWKVRVEKFTVHCELPEWTCKK